MRSFFVESKVIDKRGKVTRTFFNLKAMSTAEAYSEAQLRFNKQVKIVDINVQETVESGFIGKYYNNDRF